MGDPIERCNDLPASRLYFLTRLMLDDPRHGRHKFVTCQRLIQTTVNLQEDLMQRASEEPTVSPACTQHDRAVHFNGPDRAPRPLRLPVGHHIEYNVFAAILETDNKETRRTFLTSTAAT